MFVGRRKELSQISRELCRNEKSAILIYGRRRIGKSTLIAESIKDYDGEVISYRAVPDELSENARRLSYLIADVLNLPRIPFENMEDLLNYILKLDKRFILVIDEYQDLRKRAKGEVVDAYFRDFIDRAGDNIKIFISGSAIRIMKSLLTPDNPLYGRFSLIIPLGELNYLEASLFYPEKSIREKIALYGVFGGLPIVLQEIRKDFNVKENIKRLFLEKGGGARSYTEDILLGELKNIGGAYTSIIRIGNGKRIYSEIESGLQDESNRNSLSYTLDNLVASEFISKKECINNMRKRRKCFYEISINMLRFYLTYIDKSPSLIPSSEAFFNTYIEPSLNTFLSYQFEDIAKTYFLLLCEKGIRKDVLAIGEYWYDDPKERKNGEFDVALNTLSGYEIYEAKYLRKPLSAELMREEEGKIRQIKGLGIVKTGFLSASGFEGKKQEWMISGEDLYDLSLLE